MSKMIRFELNSRMRKLFERLGIDYKVNPEVNIPEKFYRYIRGGVIKCTNISAEGYWVYRCNNENFALDYPTEDYVGNEVANSEIFICAEEEGLSILQTAKIALSYTYALFELLKKKRADFELILSYRTSMSGDEMSLHVFDIRFYQKRENRSYLVRNLEVYNRYNGILILSISNTLTLTDSNIIYDTPTYCNDNIGNNNNNNNNKEKLDKYTEIKELLYKYNNLGFFNKKRDGTILIGQASSIATYAWLNILYYPIKADDIKQMEKRLNRVMPGEYREFLTLFSNGLNILCDTLCLYGIRCSNTSNAEREPYDIEIANLFEKPNNSTDNMFFIGWYDWDDSLLYIDEYEDICYCSKNDATPLKKWKSLESMLLEEITRLNTLVDDKGDFLDYRIKTIPI